jgi:Holliday junction DNA helicase RuvA
MIGSLRGVVVERLGDDSVLLEVGGVGYVVHVTPRTLAELEPTTPAFLHVHHHVREDAQLLYGFARRDERRTFQVLIETHGIGPSMAMAILATHSPRALVDIVAGGDVGALTLVPGVGKKTAERLLVELRDKLDVPVLDSGVTEAGAVGGRVADVRDALTALGYSADDVRQVLRDVVVVDDAEKMLRDALSLLGARRA